MAEPALGVRRSTGSRRPANLVLLVLALALLVASVVLLAREPSTASEDPRAQQLSRQYAEVTRAARAEALAFLTVDHRRMGPLTTRVLAGATGGFEKQYAAGRDDLIAQTRRSRAVSTSRIAVVGVGNVDDRSAVVYVAADSQVTNASTRGREQPRYYRLELTLVHEGDAWLTSDLRFVG